MLNFSKYLYKNKSSLLLIERVLCQKKEIDLNLSKGNMITAAIKLYLTKCKEKENLISSERKQFEFGRKYLAKMMGADPDTFTQDDIDQSIRYLFPSGLFSPEARPIMTDPSNIYLSKRQLECDIEGRPNDSFFYTGRPAFNSIMMEAVYVLEDLKSLEDRANRQEKVPGQPSDMFNTTWLSEKELFQYCGEKHYSSQYKSWLNLMEAIINHPYSSEASEFLKKMRTPVKGYVKIKDLPQPVTDPETGKKYVEAYGQKKQSMAEVRMFMPGEGRITINDESLLDAVPYISNREAILFPLQFTDTIGNVDIVAHVKESKQSNAAYALRLAISRALTCFIPEDEHARMRLAGLLTQDDRYKERKRPGQPKSRAKAAWRKR